MILAEKIIQCVQSMPEPLQMEVLDFVEFVASRRERYESAAEHPDWNVFSLATAMRGMEEEDTPDYSEEDLKVTF